MSRSEKDPVTAPLLYEARQERVFLLQERLEEIDSEVAEPRSVSFDETSRVERILGESAVLAEVTRDLVKHWESRTAAAKGKGLIAVPSRAFAMALYQQVRKQCPEWHSESESSGRIKVVMAGSQTLRERFGDPQSGLDLVVVVDLAIAGLDVPGAHTVYFLNPRRGLSLPQAVARLHRIRTSKTTGLLVDYVGMGAEVDEILRRLDGPDSLAETPLRIAYDIRGTAVVAGANTKVIEIVSHQRAYGGSPAEIHRELPHLTVSQIQMALDYALDHGQEIDEDLARRGREVQLLRRTLGQPPIVEKLRLYPQDHP